MKFAVAAAIASSAALLAACGGTKPPAQAALDIRCDTGGRHGPTGVLDWRCVDGDGEERLRPKPLHEVIEGAPIDRKSDNGS